MLKGKNRNAVENDYYCFPDKLYADCIYETIDRVRHIRNPQNPNGPKILIIKDSFVEFLYQFFVPACSEVELVDCRNYEGKILDYLKKDQPDLVLLMYNASMFLRPYMFRFDAPLPPGADYRR